MPAPHPSHQCEAPATQVSTVPSVNDRPHRRHQADRRLAALTLRALGICEDFTDSRGSSAGRLGRSVLLWAGQILGPRFGDQWLLLIRICREPAAVVWRIHDPRGNPQAARTMPATGSISNLATASEP